MIKGGLLTNQVSFAQNGDLYLPGKNTVQVAVKSKQYEVDTFSNVPSQNSNVGGVKFLNSDLLAVYSGSEINVFNLKTSKLVKSFSGEDSIRQVLYSSGEDRIFVLNTEGVILSILNASKADSQIAQPTQLI
jgi:hypothetical protein